MANGDNCILGQTNTATSSTTVNSSGGVTLVCSSKNGIGIQGSGELIGVVAEGTNTGVNARGGFVGVYGAANEEFAGSTRADTLAGVNGVSNYAYGVLGQSYGNYGVVGLSQRGSGVFGFSHSDSGVYGHSNGGAGIVGSTGNPEDYAGYFWGRVWINGDLIVAGAKAAAVPYPDGSHRLLYALESPESWFEDFGATRLVRGKVRVPLARDFARLVRADTYFVFLTPEGDSNGLYVSRKDKTGFEVREQCGGTSRTRFSYRVVAKRRDIRTARLAKVKPAARRPDLPERAHLRPLRTAKEPTRRRPTRPS